MKVRGLSLCQGSKAKWLWGNITVLFFAYFPSEIGSAHFMEKLFVRMEPHCYWIGKAVG